MGNRINDLSEFILSPPATQEPKINGAKVFGVRPGSPFLFKIPATGKKPIRYSVKNLPDGLDVDENTGIITGKIGKEGTYDTRVIVSNDLGKRKRKFRIICGDQICLTPPMGWNSWYVNSLWVSQEKVERTAKAMKDKGLADHGWTYINIDDGWQGFRNSDGNKAIQPNDKFPDMKGMCDYIHSLGLKAGIYSGPWIGTYAGYIGGSAINDGLDYSEYYAGENYRMEKNQLFGNPQRMRGRLYKKFGMYLGDQDARQWAEWGFDYLKYDWYPNDLAHATEMLESLKSCGRDIVYSLSNRAPFELAREWTEIANLWRTTWDITDLWIAVSLIGFRQDKWRKFGGPGHWNDPDMLQVGLTAHPHKPSSSSIATRLSPDEQYSQMSLWCLLCAPLLLSCDIENMDDFTLNLLTNDEVLEINQDPLGQQAGLVKRNTIIPFLIQNEVWAKDMEDGSKAVGMFNRGLLPVKVSVSWSRLGLEGKHNVRDLWRQKDMDNYSDKFEVKVPAHGVFLVKISKL